MKKKISIAVLIVLILVMLTALVACNNEETYSKRLQSKGYEVEAIVGKTYEPDYDGGYIEIFAEKSKSEDYVAIKIFDKKSDADRYYSTCMTERGSDGKSVYQDGKVVMYGTAQGVNDARD